MAARKKARKAAEPAAFRSAKELREILDAVLREIDRDPDSGARLRAAAVPMRLEFPDLKLSLTIAAAERGGSLRWDFATKAGEAVKPKLELMMESGFANRFLQGRENPAIAIARGRLRATVDDAGAALCFFGSAMALFSSYRAVIAENYPHLAID
jgi:hypothetical protein